MALKARNVSYSYTGNDFAIQGIDLIVDVNKKTSIIGPNGCGKTTLLKAMCGILRPQGDVVYHSKNIYYQMTPLERAQAFSFVPSYEYGFHDILVYELLLLSLKTVNTTIRHRILLAKVDEIIQKLSIGILAYKNFHELSAGEKQLVMLSCALIKEPEMLFLDESLNNLDIRNTKMTLDIISEYCKVYGMGCLSIVHDINQAIGFSDRIIALKNGRLLLEGDVLDVINKCTLEQVFDMEIEITYIDTRPYILY